MNTPMLIRTHWNPKQASYFYLMESDTILENSTVFTIEKSSLVHRIVVGPHLNRESFFSSFLAQHFLQCSFSSGPSSTFQSEKSLSKEVRGDQTHTRHINVCPFCSVVAQALLNFNHILSLTLLN